MMSLDVVALIGSSRAKTLPDTRATGPVMTYYEFKHPMGDRLKD